MINIVIPVLGKGRRFAEAGYTKYKAELPVGNKTMIEAVIENLTPSQEHTFHILTRDRFPQDTEGAACSVLLIEDEINNDDPLIIANSDQLVDVDINDFLREADGFDAMMMTFPNKDSKWSYAVGSGSLVNFTIEKPDKPLGEDRKSVV